MEQLPLIAVLLTPTLRTLMPSHVWMVITLMKKNQTDSIWSRWSGYGRHCLEAGTGLSVARSGDKITFTNTLSDNTDVDVSNANLLNRLANLESAGGASDQNITIGADSGDTIVITVTFRLTEQRLQLTLPLLR